MPQICPKCRRANPADALYCYEDGFSLGRITASGPVDPGAQFFPHPFVFPDGALCRNFDQLAIACCREWDVAIELIRNGDLASFFAGLGRSDLAKTVREAAREEDKDRALDQILGQLPAKTVEPAKLCVEPLQFNLGQLTVGKDQRWELRLENGGMRLLTGTISCDDCIWLALGDGGGSPRKVFQFRSGLVIPVHVRGRLLHSAAKAVVGRLTIETNGGAATVVVTAEVPVKPFAEGVLAGAVTPRQIAEKAKASPKAAAALFENGGVARWYIQNGWTYPVQGPSASGVAAVQQYFEALGLTTPPKVEVREQSIFFESRPGDSAFHTLEVAAVEKRPIFASAVSDQLWLKVHKIDLDGRTAHIRLAVDPVPDRPGESLDAKLTVRANGNQRFVIPVSLRILGKPRTTAAEGYSPFPTVRIVEEAPTAAPAVRLPPRTPAPAAAPEDGSWRDAPPPVRKKPTGGWLLPLLPIAFIVLGLSVTLARDAAVRILAGDAEERNSSAAGPTGPPLIDIQFHDHTEPVALGTEGIKAHGRTNGEGFWDATMRFGLVMTDAANPKEWGRKKRLTFDSEGRSNNCCVRLDGQDMLFGEQPFRVAGEPRDPLLGRWLELAGDLGARRQGKRSVWAFDAAPSVPITQTVELTAGEESGRLDTCLVRYRIDNKDTIPHSVGLRFLLDTYIGANDGVPFLIPGQNQFCTTQLVIAGPAVPSYIQACEQQDLADPGAVARLQFRLGNGVEPPNRVTLGAYPSISLAKRMNDSALRPGKDDVGRAGLRHVDSERFGRGDLLGRANPTTRRQP